MNPLDLFLEGGKALKIIFKIGFIPKEEDFEEFSESDYEKYHKEVGETEGKMYRFVQGKWMNQSMFLHLMNLKRKSCLKDPRLFAILPMII